MSLEHGMAALNLEMPPRVPRTEYSAEEHWGLIKAVTGIDVSAASASAVKWEAAKKFRTLWNYDFNWSILIYNQVLGEYRSNMGHAEYVEGGEDFNNEISQLFSDPEDVFAFDCLEKLGTRDHNELVLRFDEHYDSLATAYPDMVNMTGVYITCMSGLIELLGWDTLLMAAGIDDRAFGAFTNRYIQWISQYFTALADCKAPVVMVHDDIVWTSGAFLKPEWYREYIFPNYRKLFDPLFQAGKKVIYTSDGNYTEFIDDIAACGIHGFVMEPTTDMAYIAEKYGKTHAFIGNADTRILLSGTKEDIHAEVKRCMDIGKKYPGFFMAVGNHIPFNTPVDNALWYNECYEKLSIR
ncbi:MAG: hypothetical protein LBG95_04215 [Treponema sp.]|jgi:hypothetical protein|nr:hypothetical protein [Treponema sp.]